MPIYFKDNKVRNVYVGSSKIGEIYAGSSLVYRSTYAVTYHIDTNSAKVEYRVKGDDLLSPSFTPTKAGYTFVGWRMDAQADAAVLTSKVMGKGGVALYAVFRKDVTVTYYDGSTAAKTSVKSQYYNNGNIANPSFTLTQASKGGWTARGWSTSNAGNGGITYNNGATFSRDSNVTLYGLYQQTITVTYYNNSSTASKTTGTRYWAPAGYVNPSFTLTQASKSGWTARGWSTSNAGNGGITYNNGATFSRDSNVTLYGLYQQTITVTYYNNSTTASTKTGTRYWAPAGYVNPSFTLTQASKSGWSARGWSTGTAADSAITYNSGAAFARDSSVTLYGMYQQTITATYSGNGNTGGSVAADTGTRYYNSNTATKDPTFTLKANGFTKTGYDFNGWSGAPVSTIGQTFQASASLTITATWVPAIVYWIKKGKFADGYTNVWAKSGITVDDGSTVIQLSRGTGYVYSKNPFNQRIHRFGHVTLGPVTTNCRVSFAIRSGSGVVLPHKTVYESNGGLGLGVNITFNCDMSYWTERGLDLYLYVELGTDSSNRSMCNIVNVYFSENST